MRREMIQAVLDTQSPLGDGGALSSTQSVTFTYYSFRSSYIRCGVVVFLTLLVVATVCEKTTNFARPKGTLISR